MCGYSARIAMASSIQPNQNPASQSPAQAGALSQIIPSTSGLPASSGLYAPGRDDAWYLRNGMTADDLAMAKARGSMPGLAGLRQGGFTPKGSGGFWGDPNQFKQLEGAPPGTPDPSWQVGLKQNENGDYVYGLEDVGDLVDDGKFWRESGFSKWVATALAALGGAAAMGTEGMGTAFGGAFSGLTPSAGMAGNGDLLMAGGTGFDGIAAPTAVGGGGAAGAGSAYGFGDFGKDALKMYDKYGKLINTGVALAGKALDSGGSSQGAPSNGGNSGGGDVRTLPGFNISGDTYSVFNPYEGDVSQIPLQNKGPGEHQWFKNTSSKPMKKGGLAHYADGGLFDDFDLSGFYPEDGPDISTLTSDDFSNGDYYGSSSDDWGGFSPEFLDLEDDVLSDAIANLGRNDTFDFGRLVQQDMDATSSSGGGSKSGDFMSSFFEAVKRNPQLLMTGLGLVNSLMNRKKQSASKAAAEQLKNPLNSWTPAQQASADKYFNNTPVPVINQYKGDVSRAPIVGGEHKWFHADGGLALDGDPREVPQGALNQVVMGPGIVRGEGGGQDDMVNAMLSPGEYIFDAESVSALGDGDTDAGAAQLDNLRMSLRKHKRSASPDSIAPKAKEPMQYMNGGKYGG